MSPNAKGAIFALLGFAIFSAHDVIVKYLGSQYSTFQVIFFFGPVQLSDDFHHAFA